VVGAFERLATLGLIDENIPWRVSQKAVELWQEIDENRFREFGSFLVIAALADKILQSNGVEDQGDRKQLIETLSLYWGDKTRYKLAQLMLERNSI
jgi:hypothetical protein